MIRAIFLATALISAASAWASDDTRLKLNCRSADGALNFTVDRSAYTVSFSNKSAMGNAQLPLNRALGAVIEGKRLTIQYDWYFSAQYRLTFARDVRALVRGEQVRFSLSGDDSDGAFFEDVTFLCDIR